VNDARRTRRRVAVTILLVVAVFAVFVVRLVDIQVVRADDLNTDSLAKRSIAETTYAARGDIVDTEGNVLAGSVDRFDITAAPNVMNSFMRTADDDSRVEVSVEQAIAELSEVTGTSVAEITASLTEDPEANFAYVTRSVPLETLNKINDLGIPWIYPRLNPGRTYPNGAIAGNLVGFLNTDGPGAGLELSENACLTSTNGSSTYERGSDGIRIPGSTVTSVEAQEGGTLHTTINRDFQWYAQQTLNADAQGLGADWATLMVVRVNDGHLMAVADYPSVDPNNVDGSPNTAFGSLAFSTPYEPGSTMKAMTVASLLDAGAITPTERVSVPSLLTLPSGGTIKDAFVHPDVRYTVAGVLTNSSNIGTSLLSQKLDKDARRDYMLKFGLTERTAVGFNGESPGYVPATQNWDERTNYAVQFGQAMQTTSAQIASIYQTLGNGGVRMPLTLVEGCEAADGTVTEIPSTEGVRAVSENAADATVALMENVVSQGSLSSALSIPDYRIAAKTGTAEVSEGGVYTSDRVVSIAGLVPAENPEYAIVVTFGKPDTIKTSAAVAPTFKKITNQVIKTFRIEPSTTPTVKLPLTW
jgi:cell division protein FtsI (penicillin-binding protein 3)